MRAEIHPAMVVSAMTRGKTPWKRLVFSARPSDFSGPVPRTGAELRAKVNAAFARVLAHRRGAERRRAGEAGRGG